ncbi:MAG: hypothetical protein DCO96_11605 [Fluviicola sp. XM-24bin1]|nr:MAG: hypothetical protein DCO96_11605 [Fluviicola sp. XM-24bin1]
MKEALFGLVCLISTTMWSQGLNGELGYNDDYSQNAKGIVAFDDFSIFIKEQTESASFFTSSSLIKIDTLGNEIWEIPITPQAAEVVLITEMIPAETGGLYVLGYARPTCDVSGGCFWFLIKVDPNGTIEWSKSWSDAVCFGTEVSGLSLTQNNEILIHYNDPLDSYIFTISTQGVDLDNIQTTANGFQGMDHLSGYHSVAYKQFSLFGFDGNGNQTASRTFSSFISDAVVWNDSLFITTTDSLFILDNSFQDISAEEITGYTDFRQLKVRNGDIRCISTSSNDVTLFYLNRDLQIADSETINVAEMQDQPIDYSDDHLAIASDFALSEYFAIRHLDFSLNDPQNVAVNRTDIGIADIQITQSSVTPNPNFNAVFQVEIGADVLLKNYGNNTLQSCRMNHYISPALACGLIYYGEEFFNLNLAPGDSVWVSLGVIHTNERSFPTDSLNQEICIYTSYPNSVTDLNESNDRLCTTVTMGTANVSELSTAEKEVVKIVDLLGREVNYTTNEWVILIYSDGSTEKIFRME